jgi:hypothetical protein
MISFWISVVPPKIDRTWLSRQAHNRGGEQWTNALMFLPIKSPA